MVGQMVGEVSCEFMPALINKADFLLLKGNVNVDQLY